MKGYLQPVGMLCPHRPPGSDWPSHRSPPCPCSSRCPGKLDSLDGELLTPGMISTQSRAPATCAPTWYTCRLQERRQLDIAHSLWRHWLLCLWPSLLRQGCHWNQRNSVMIYRLFLKWNTICVLINICYSYILNTEVKTQNSKTEYGAYIMNSVL